MFSYVSQKKKFDKKRRPCIRWTRGGLSVDDNGLRVHRKSSVDLIRVNLSLVSVLRYVDVHTNKNRERCLTLYSAVIDVERITVKEFEERTE